MTDQTNGTSWTNIVYIGIVLLGYFAIKSTSPTQSGYQQVSLNNWKPMTKEDKLSLGVII